LITSAANLIPGLSIPDALQVALDVPASEEDAAGSAVDHFERGVLLLLEPAAKMPVEEADGDLLVVIERGQRLGRNEGEDAPGRGGGGRHNYPSPPSLQSVVAQVGNALVHRLSCVRDCEPT